MTTREKSDLFWGTGHSGAFCRQSSETGGLLGRSVAFVGFIVLGLTLVGYALWRNNDSTTTNPLLQSLEPAIAKVSGR